MQELIVATMNKPIANLAIILMASVVGAGYVEMYKLTKPEELDKIKARELR